MSSDIDQTPPGGLTIKTFTTGMLQPICNVSTFIIIFVRMFCLTDMSMLERCIC